VRRLSFCWCVLAVLLVAQPLAAATPPPRDDVAVEILEEIPDEKTWDFDRPEPVDRFHAKAFGFAVLPRKFTNKGLQDDRSNPLLLRARCRIDLPAGEFRFLLRSRGAARLLVDGQPVVENKFLIPNASGHEPVPKVQRVDEPGLPPLPVGHQERLVTTVMEAGEHDCLLEAFAGGKNLRLELGELAVCVARPGQQLELLGASLPVPFTEAGWSQYVAESTARQRARDHARRRTAAAGEDIYWEMRHDLARREMSDEPGPQIPQTANAAAVHNAIDAFINRKLEKQNLAPAPLCDDASFLRRVSLDVAGVIPSSQQIRTFFEREPSTRRAKTIIQLLDDPRWADHWVGYWQDVLAENPALLKPHLNNTGPFRWWIHESFLDNKPIDRFVTELVLMEGSKYGGAPAGFGLATMNDVPMAAKAHVIAKAFLGVELQCARCHDAPYHPYKQRQLFSFGAMLAKTSLKVPIGSTVDLAGRTRQPQVDITLAAGTAVDPVWPFAELAAAEISDAILREPNNSRERLAAYLTSAANKRFARVMVNRLWKRYLGWGLVEPVDDWTDTEPSHPQLLEFLARELVINGYDLRHVARLILSSHTYQRSVQPGGSEPVEPQDRLFASPARRRMSAEQAVDSLFIVAGKRFHTEPLTLDPEGRRPVTQFLNLGTPQRAWQFTSLSNDRDRPALSLPFAQNIVDLLIVLGWRESRQNPLTVRDLSPTLLQPMVLAHGNVGSRITTLSDDSEVTELALKSQSLPELVDAVYLRVLSRSPSDEERATFVELLRDGYSDRQVPGAKAKPRPKSVPTSAVSWANHLDPEASRIKLELAEQARAGDPPTDRLEPDWRERMEDMLWVLVNSPEFLFIP
jgi:hypothetical protein